MNNEPLFLRLKASGLLTPEQLRDVEQCFASTSAETAIAQDLIGRGVLTPYQAQHLLLDLERPLVLGQYRILEEIGRGGMGHVYKALHTVMGRVVALKIIAADLVKDPHAQRLFRREVQAATLLQHPNIAMAYDANECAGEHFLVMEYVDGPDLDAVVRRHGGLPIALVCSLMRQTAEALQYAHEKGMVHRDVKPANLLLAGWDDGALGPWLHDSAAAPPLTLPMVKVLDFGIARLRLPAGAETLPVRNPGNVIGTPDYIAPEQAHNIHAADVRSDLYSLGCTFYYALAGRVPFPGESALEKLFHHALEDATPLATFRSDVPPEVAAIVGRLMEKDPDRRFQTPGELARALRPWCGLSAPPHPAKPISVVATPTDAPAPAEAGESVACPSDEAVSPIAEPSLAEAWCHWVDIVEGFARHKGNRLGTSETEYAALYKLALAACRSCEDAAGSEKRRPFRDLRERVQPWLSLEVLARADREILGDLLAHCRHLEPLLTGARRRRSGRGITVVVCLTAGLFVFAWWAMGRPGFQKLPHSETWLGSVLETARRVIASLGSEVQAHPILWGSALCALVVLVSIYLVARLPRV